MISNLLTHFFVCQSKPYLDHFEIKKNLHADDTLLESRINKPWLLCQLPVLRVKLIYSNNAYERTIGKELENLHISLTKNQFEQSEFKILAYTLSNNILSMQDEGFISMNAMQIAINDVAVQYLYSAEKSSELEPPLKDKWFRKFEQRYV